MRNLIYSIFFFTCALSGQGYVVKYEYSHKIERDKIDTKLLNAINGTKNYIQLEICGDYSRSSILPSSDTTINGLTYKSKQYVLTVYIKNRTTTTLQRFDQINAPNTISSEQAFTSKDWSINYGAVKTIGGFLCYAARLINQPQYPETNVWFTPDIPIADGPWEYGGLPGLILEVQMGKVRNISVVSISRKSGPSDCFPERSRFIETISGEEYDRRKSAFAPTRPN